MVKENKPDTNDRTKQMFTYCREANFWQGRNTEGIDHNVVRINTMYAHHPNAM